MDPLAVHAFRTAGLAASRYDNPLKLSRYGYKAYSQNDEDGIIAEIFRRIGTATRSFVEIGVEAGVECNTLWLLMQGWSGLWIEAHQQHCDLIRSSHAHWLDSQQLTLRQAFVDGENVNDLIASRYQSGAIDFLSIDVDFNDYWIWNSITTIRPRVVAIEYNASWAPPASMTVPYHPQATWDGSNYFGASLAAMAALGAQKGYELVGCTFSGVNAFFVSRDLLGDKFLEPGDVAEHYEPPRYFLAPLPSGHPPRAGPVVAIDHRRE